MCELGAIRSIVLRGGDMLRRDFLGVLATAAAWPFPVYAPQPAEGPHHQPRVQFPEAANAGVGAEADRFVAIAPRGNGFGPFSRSCEAG